MINETNGNMGCNTGGAAANASMVVRNEELEYKIKRLAEEIIDMAVNNMIDKCCDLVMAENDEEMVDGRVEDVDSDDEGDMFGVLVNDVRRKRGVVVVDNFSNSYVQEHNAPWDVAGVLTEVTELPHLAAALSHVPGANDLPATVAP
jgi:hypothetical protein